MSDLIQAFLYILGGYGVIAVLIVLFLVALFIRSLFEPYDSDDYYVSESDGYEWQPPDGMERRQPRTEVRTYQARHQRRERPVPGSNGSKVQMSRWIQSRPRDEEW